MPDLVQLIKKVAMEAIEEKKPTAIVYGQVTSTSPLMIAIDQRLILSAAQLILTNNVRDHDVEMSLNHFTENTSGGIGESSFAEHNHAYMGRKTFTVHNALAIGDQVIMIRIQGGQKFLVMEKVVAL